MKKMITTSTKKIAYAICAMLVMALTIVLTGAEAVEAKATKETTVRVSTQKELDKAINDPDIFHIVFETEAYITVTINENDLTKGKYIEIGAKNAKIINKAVFDRIDLHTVKSYTEKASGNNYVLYDFSYNGGMTVAKGKTVKSIKICSDNYETPLYTLRKGAKVKEVELSHFDDLFASSKYDKKERKLTIKAKNREGVAETHTVVLDKRGRIIKVALDSEVKETCFAYEYKYDKNGNIIKKTGFDSKNPQGELEINYTYTDSKLTKEVTTGKESVETIYEYDAKDRMIRRTYSGTLIGENGEYNAKGTDEYEYDKKGRTTLEKYTDSTNGDEFVYKYTYDKKGFNVKIECDHYNGLYVYTILNEYDKAGDLVKQTTLDQFGDVDKVVEF